MEDVNVIAFDGEIDISRRLWIEHELSQIKLFDPKSLTIVDLTGVRYADTTLLNALVQVQERAVCIVAPKIISRLFEVTALDRVFPTFDDVSSARLSREARLAQLRAP